MLEGQIAKAFDAIHERSNERAWILGRLGTETGSNEDIDVVGRPGYVVVSMGGNGNQGVTIARDSVGAARTNFQQIRMVRENGELVIREAAAYAGGTDTGGGGGVDTFMELTDVQATGWDNGEVPQWNAALGKLVPATLSAGTTYAGGQGIDIFAGTIGVKRVPTTSGLAFNGSNEMYVNLGPGLTVSGGAIVLNDTVAGNGLVINPTTKQIDVYPLDGTLLAASNSLAVNQGFAYTWTGLHTFRTDPQVENDIDFVSAVNHNIVATNSLTLKPAAELILDPGTLITYPSSQESKMNGYLDSVSGIKGFRIWDYSVPLGTANTMMLTITAIKADEIMVRKFTADEARVRRGEWFLAYSYGDVQADFVMPAINATVDVWFEEAPGLGTLALFQANDWVKLRTVDMTSVNLATSVWFQAVGVGANGYIQRLNADAANNIPSRQQWRLVRRNGGATNQVVKRGETMVDFGAIGQGMIEMSALEESGGPFIRTATFDSVVSNVPSFKNRVQMGRLSGTVDYSTNVRWGFAAGNDLSLTPAFGFSGVAIDDVKGARFFNTDVMLYEGSIVATLLSRTYGLSVLNDTAMFAHNLRNIAWYDNLPADGNLSGSTATAKIGTWGGTNDRRLHLNAYGSNLAGVFLDAVGDSGADQASLSVKGGGWYGVTGGYIEMVSQYITNVTPDVLGNQRPRFRVGGDSGSVARTNFHVYVDDGGVLDTTGMMMEQAGAGDAAFHWKVAGYQFVAGIDHFTNTFKIKAGNTLRGGLASIEINPTTGVVTINGLSGSGTGTLNATGGDGLTLTGTEFKVNDTVARTWTTVAGSAGGGIAGGGNLGGNIVLYLDSTVVRTNANNIIADGAIGGGGNLASNVHISLELAANSGLNQTAGLAIDPSAAGNGLTHSGGAFHVGGGYGIVVTANGIAVDPSILDDGGGGGGADYAAGDGLVRTGTSPNYTLDVVGVNGIIAGLDSLSLDNAYVLATTLAGRTLTAGAGLAATGTGNLASNRTFDVGQGTGIIVDPDSIKLNDAYVLATVLAGRSIIAGDGLMGSATTLNNNITIDFKGGTGLIVTADLVKLDDPYVLTTLLAQRTVTAGSGLIGGGALNNAEIIINVDPGAGISIVGDKVLVDKSHAYVWTGVHQFNAIPQINGNMNFMVDASITGAANITLAPVGDIILAPSGADPDVLPGGSSLVDLGDYNRKWRSFYAGEMVVQSIVSADVMATIGGNVRVGPTSVLIAPFLIGATTIDLKHNSFTQYTYLILETVSGVSLLPQTETIRVTSASPTTITGGFRYTVTRNATGAGGATGGAGGEKNWQAGDAVFSLGRVESNGYVDIASVDTVMGHIGPTVTVYARKVDPVPASPITSQTWNNLKPVVAMGNLASFAGISGTKFGFAAANDLTLNSSNGLSGIVVTDAGMNLYNTTIQMNQGNNMVMAITPDWGMALEATANADPAAGPLARMNRIEWYDDLATANTALPLAFIQTTPMFAGQTMLILVSGSGAGSNQFNGAVTLRTHRVGGQYVQLTLDSNFTIEDSGINLITAENSTGFTLNRTMKLTGATGSETQLIINRAPNTPSIQGWTDWLIMDGHSPASGNVGLNYYSQGDVILAYGQGLGGKVGIHTLTPEAPVHIVDISTAGVRGLLIEQNTSDAASASMGFRKSRGNNVAKTIVANGDYVGAFSFTAWDGDQFLILGGIAGIVSGTAANNSIPMSIDFVTGATHDPNFNNKRMRINSAGDIGIGTIDIEATHANFGTMQLGLGGYIMYAKASTTPGMFIAQNVYYDGVWKRRSAAPGLMINMDGGQMTVSAMPTGTANVNANADFKTALVITNAADVAIGLAAPLGKLHVHDGVGGKIFASRTGVNGTAQNIVTGISKHAYGTVMATDGTNATALNIGVGGNSFPASQNLTCGTGTLTFTLSGGTLSVRVSAGSGTFSVSCNLVYQ